MIFGEMFLTRGCEIDIYIQVNELKLILMLLLK